MDSALPRAVSAAWQLDPGPATRLGSGLINQTWQVSRGGESFVLQQLNPMFRPEVNLDIAAVTTHLAARGLLTPRLLPTVDGAWWLLEGGQCWRLQTLMPGQAPERVRDAAMAAAAGDLLGRFHRALADFEQDFASPRAGVHDFARHRAALLAALERHARHPAHGRIAPLAAEMLRLAEELPALAAGLPLRVVHGDPKISNLLFTADGQHGLCLVDLDTLGRMPLVFDLGDACRSWCNPGGEDGQGPAFSLELFAAVLAGYAGATRGWLAPAEWQGWVPAIALITLNLAMRFAADALNESYFGWDAKRYPDRSAHNEQRARNQLQLFHSLREHWPQAEALLASAFEDQSGLSGS